jgi:hypothetical protein
MRIYIICRSSYEICHECMPSPSLMLVSVPGVPLCMIILALFLSIALSNWYMAGKKKKKKKKKKGNTQACCSNKNAILMLFFVDKKAYALLLMSFSLNHMLFHACILSLASFLVFSLSVARLASLVSTFLIVGIAVAATTSREAVLGVPDEDTEEGQEDEEDDYDDGDDDVAFHCCESVCFREYLCVCESFCYQGVVDRVICRRRSSSDGLTSMVCILRLRVLLRG